MWEQLIGAGLSLGGDLITKFTEREDANSGSSSSTLGPNATSYDAMIDAQDKAQSNYGKLMNQSMFSAGGTIGKNETQRMFEQKTNELSNSANAYNTANALNQDANTLRTAALQTGTDAVRNNRLQNKGNRRNVLNALMQNGGTRGSIAAAVNQLNEGTVASNQQVLSQSNDAMRANIAAAGQAQAQGQQILDQNLTVRSQIYRDPYKAEMKDPAQALNAITGAGQTAGQQFSTSQQMNRDRSSDFRGIQGFLGSLSGEYGSAGAFDSLFGTKLKEWTAKNNQAVGGKP